MKRSIAVLTCALALVAAACGAKGDDKGVAQGASSTTTAAGGSSSGVKFGDLDSPCGPGNAKVAAGEGGKGTDKLYLGVANDRGSTIRPGLNKEVWDASQSFIKWCNDQGGISGLKIEPVDLDGQLLQVQAAMTTACKSVFAMV
ncbi:MAG: hypothetical protein ACKOYM_02980, partial [Actinomycetes bacterium]